LHGHRRGLDRARPRDGLHDDRRRHRQRSARGGPEGHGRPDRRQHAVSAAANFRVGLSRDILAKNGEPSFGRGPLELLDADARIAWEFLPQSVDEITPDIMASYDGLYVNSPRVGAAAVAGGDLRVKIVARHGVGYDSVDVPALARRGVIVTNTPVAVRRPV